MTLTGIYGGSFNPIHKGHVQLAEALCHKGVVNEIWFLVSPRNPFKQASKDLLDEHDRLSLARLATAGHPQLHVSDFEFSLPRPSYTVDTLAALRKAYPDRQFALIMGADNWQSFHRWRKPDDILRHHRILVYPRPEFPVDETALPPGVILLSDVRLMDISSTQLRRSIARGEDASYGLDAAVWQEIQKKGYYRTT